MNRSSRVSLYLILFATLTSTCILAKKTSPYLPVVLVSGLDDDSAGMKPMVNLIQKYLPGTYIKNVQIGLGKITSFWGMHDQGECLAYQLYNDHNLRNGCNIVAHSQGGLSARYFIQRFNHPGVYNYIALGTPQRGIDGLPDNLGMYKWLHLFETHLSTILYLSFFQKCVSFAGYWNDSLRYNDYLNTCSFLPYLNNEKAHKFAPLFKENICKLQNMVLVQSTQEDIVTPADSCHFSFYKQGSMTEIEPLFASDIYTHDTLGLKTLYESGRLQLREANCTHVEFHSDEQNFIDNILPFLTLNQNMISLESVNQPEQAAITA